MIEDDPWRASREATRSGDVCRDDLDAVEIQLPRFEHEAVSFLFAALLAADGASAVRQIAEHPVKLLTSVVLTFGGDRRALRR